MNRIPHSASSLGSAEADAARRSIEANYVGHGPRAAELEARFRQRTGRRFAFSVSSGSHALALAVRALDLPSGSPVALPVLTCASVAAAVAGAGHRARLVDIRSDLTINAAQIPGDTVAVIAPHAYGAPVDAAALSALGIPWIEDCATSPATIAGGRIAGAGGTLAIFSLGSTKYFTGGSGGVLVTDDDTLAARVTDLLDFDRAPRASWEHGAPAALPGRLPDLNAAVALVQFDRLSEFAARRQAIAAIYDEALATAPHLAPPPRAGHSYYRYVVKTEVPAETIATALKERGIDARSAINPWLDEQPFPGLEAASDSFPVADDWRHHLLSLPIHPGMTDAEATFVIRTLRELTDHAQAA